MKRDDGRIQKTLYISEGLDQKLRMHAAKHGIQQSEVTEKALTLYLSRKKRPE